MPELLAKAKDRIWEIDLLRALAVLGMLCFHWFYLLDFWHIQNTDLFDGSWDIFGDTIRNTFFAVVGASLVLSYQRHQVKETPWFEWALKNVKRGLILLVLGGIITIISYAVAPEDPIRFGVLSFIGAALIIFVPLVGRWYWLLPFTLFIWGLDNLATWTHESLLAYILGFFPYYWPSLDYFPLVPWLASVGGGAVVATLIFKNGQRRYPFLKQPLGLWPIVWVGQKALIIYLVHIPVFAVIIKGLEALSVY